MRQVPGKAQVIGEWGLLVPSPDLLGEGWLEIELHNLDSDADSFWVGELIEMLGGKCTLSPYLALLISLISEPFLSDIPY